MTSPNELTYFTVTGHWYDIEAPSTSGSTNTPQFLVVSAFVTFTPRLEPGTVEYINNLDIGGGVAANVGLALAPVTARIWDGALATINQADTTGVQLVANSPILGLQQLIYDVNFTQVVYASATQTLTNFAFTAPTTAATIDLTSPDLTRLPYAPLTT